MKKQSMYIRLQNQYKKLNSRIQKSIKNGKFYQFTQFKQEQLFARLKRYSLQMKQVAAGIAVVGALGVATPAVGQVTPWNLVEHTGVDNPLQGIGSSNVLKPVFVDIDNDGDMDCFYTTVDFPMAIINTTVQYFENTGTSTSPSFVERTGVNNPFDGVTNTKELAFVDIDNDGDMDAFSSNWDYVISEDCYFYENTGSAFAPSFSLDTVNNPLDSVSTHLSAVTAPANISAHLSFVDMDNDGDMDCFAAVNGYYAINLSDDLWYYENIGTASVANFARQSSANNPLGSLLSSQSVSFRIVSPIIFEDIGNDGDMDALFSVRNFSTSANYNPFYENTGTSSSPSFVLSPTSPVDSAINSLSAFSLVDIDGDSDLDVFRVVHSSDSLAYFENTTFTALSKIAEESVFIVYPNPTTGNLIFETPLTGQLHLFNLTGQEVLARELENTQEINLSKIENGLYILTIETAKERIRKTILIEK
jgi:hypothetical protein